VRSRKFSCEKKAKIDFRTSLFLKIVLFWHVVKHGVESGIFFGVEFGVIFGVNFGVNFGADFKVL
jgi:hypothetical protein